MYNLNFELIIVKCLKNIVFYFKFILYKAYDFSKLTANDIKCAKFEKNLYMSNIRWIG